MTIISTTISPVLSILSDDPAPYIPNCAKDIRECHPDMTQSGFKSRR